MKSVLETIQSGTAYLEKRQIAEARLNMEHLLAHQLSCSRMELYTQFDRPLQEHELAPLRDLLRKRGEGIPLQHLQGEVSFLGRDFSCDSRGLIPRPETEELVEMILTDLPSGKCTVLDVGSGSGIIGLSLAAERPNDEVTLVDVSEEALQLSRENQEKLGISNATFLKSHLFEGVTGSFDLIVANLPYVPETDAAAMAPELAHDPALALFSGKNGLDLLREFIPVALEFLKPGGLLALEIGHDQGETVHSLLEENGFTEITVRKDLSGISRFPFAKRP